MGKIADRNFADFRKTRKFNYNIMIKREGTDSMTEGIKKFSSEVKD